MKQPTDRELAMMWNELSEGVSYVNCPKCGKEYTVEPDGDYECHEPDCDGRVRSKMMELGFI